VKQHWFWVALWCGLSLLAAAFVRYEWIESSQVAAPCDSGITSVLCTVRSWIVQAFVHQRLGWAALGFAATAYTFKVTWVAGFALFLACCGLVLYSTELSAPAALLAALVFAKDSKTANPAGLT
jgi:hypothetical protein